MEKNSDYDILFEPVKIGPKIAKNRFYQVPHCNGMGYMMPRTHAAMREMKAEGGWGVVCTEYCSIHSSSDDHPAPFAALWDDNDVRAYALMTEKVHRHGALAGAQLWYGGSYVANMMSCAEYPREPRPLAGLLSTQAVKTPFHQWQSPLGSTLEYQSRSKSLPVRSHSICQEGRELI